MRRATLLSILNLYRAEARVSLNQAHNTQVRESQILLLQRVQSRLWEEFDWPHLRIVRNYPLVAGQRFYDLNGDFDLERLNRISVKVGGYWLPLDPTLDDRDYLIWDSELDARASPVRKWRLYENERVEVWPISDQNGVASTLDGYLKVRGIAKLSPFVADTDRADLDDNMIALFAAAETLAASGAKDAAIKLKNAESHMARLQGRLMKTRRFAMFGVEQRPVARRPLIYAYRSPV